MRDRGVDALRGVALVSMYVAHTAPTGGPAGVFNLSEYLTYPLFAALVGMGAALGRSASCRATLVRGGVLIATGLALDRLDTNVVVILVYLGLLTWIAYAFDRFPSAVVIVLGLLAWGFAPAVRHSLLHSRLELYVHGHVTTAHLLDYVATGDEYQLLSVIGYAAAGILLMRLTRGAGALVAPSRRLMLGGFLLAVSGAFGFLEAHTADPMVAYEATVREHLFCLLLVVSVSLLVLGLEPSLGRLSDGLAAMGRMTLSLYALQICYLSLWAHQLHPGLPDDRWSNTMLLTLGSLLFALLWPLVVRRGPFRRGPLEGLTTLVVDAHLGARPHPVTA
jgi:hypothetical protein